MLELKLCPFCNQNRVFIGVHDDEGNYHGRVGCDYEKAPWSGLSYALHHEGWGECIMCTDGENEVMGGMLFDTAEEAAETWNRKNYDEISAVDAVPVVHGQWLNMKENLYDVKCYTASCSQCKRRVRFFVKDHCPICGAKMDLKD